MKIEIKGRFKIEFEDFIVENALILIPVLYIIGIILKKIKKVDDEFIPSILLFFGILGAISLLGLSINSVIQGILVTGAAMYTDQLLKKNKK